MQLRTQCLHVISCPKMRIWAVHISHPISRVIRSIPRHALNPLGHRTYPDCIEAHALDIIQISCETCPSAAAVVAGRDVAGGSGGEIGAGKPVDHYLVYGAFAPFVFGCGVNE